MLVPSHNRRKRTWTFSGISEIGRQEKLCNLLKKSAKTRSAKIVLQIRQNQLRLVRGENPRRTKSTLGQSVPLSTFLRDHHRRMQTFLLAYNVAMAMWQYYDTKWTNVPWTLENLHLVEDTLVDDVEAAVSSTLYLLNNFREQHQDLDWPEYCNEDGMFHRYPRAFALAQLLIDILDRQLTKPRSTSPRYKPQPINQQYAAACRHLNDVLRVKYAQTAYEIYLDAVESCLKFAANVERLKGIAANATTVVDRQEVLFQKVVEPIGLWLRKAQGSSDVQEIRGTIFRSNADAYNAVRSPRITGDEYGRLQDPILRQSEVTYQLKTEEWIKALGLSSEITSTSMVAPVRIAVLDTGCSMETPILDQRGQEYRLKKNWKDWVDTSSTPRDEHGHGTRIVSLLLRIAPKAEIHVARVARDVEDLQDATQTIANVSLTRTYMSIGL
jgi:hypothetical protein